MKNETKRSVTAVLLATAMLLSTQGITAFADTEKIELPATEITQTTEKPETPEKPAEGEGEEQEEQEEQEKPEEKPAEGEGEEQEKPEEKPAEGEGEEQEKPETETPETPADPSVVAPTPLDPATPVAPEMGIEPASIEGDGDYDHTADIVTNSPRKYIWSSESFTNTGLGDQFRVILWTQSSNGTELGTIVNDDSAPFYPGTGYRIYSIEPNDPNNWVFAGWTTNVYHDGFDGLVWTDDTPISVSDLYGIIGWKHVFSMPEGFEPGYDGESPSIRVNAILPDEIGANATMWHKLYYTLCANFNPLVTVNYNNEQGSVTADNPHGDDKFEAEYAQDKVFTITTSSAYKPYVNNTECTLTDSDVENDIYTYTYTLPSVTDPTTLNVEFEKAEDVITVDDIDGDVIINVLCPNGHSHSFNMSEGTAGQQGDYYIMSSNPSKAKVSINSKAWVKKFNELTGMVQHELTGDGYITFELTRDDPDEKWKLPDGEKEYPVTIKVKCTSKIPEPDESIISQLEVALNCVNVTDGSHNDTSKLSTFTTGYYTCTVDQEKQTATVKIDDTQAKYWIDNNINTMVGKEQHSFVSVSDPITLTYKNGQWKVPEDDNAKKIVIKMLCGPSIAQLNDQLNVKMVCDNNGVHSGNNEQFSREYDILADSYHLDMYSVGGEYRCDVTIDAPQYLSKFDQDTNATHVLMSSDNKRTLYYTEDGNWLIVPDEEKTVTFNVSCKPDINFPNPPDKETVLGLIGDVTIQCTTASSGHGQNKYSLTKDDIDFENVVPVQMTAGDEIQFTLPVTIKNAAALQSGFLANYNTLTGKTHIWSSGSIPASITLTYDSVTKAWANKDVNGIVLSVYCTTGGGTIDPNPNPGGGGDNDDDDDRYTGDNTVTRTINDDDVPLNDRPNTTTTIDDEDVPLADLPDDTVTIDDGEVPLKANPSTGDSLPFAAMAAAALSLGGVIVLNRKKK